MSDKTAAQILLDARTKLGLTQAELAEKAGINTNTYAKLERGEHKPASGSIKKLGKALHLNPSEIQSLLS